MDSTLWTCSDIWIHLAPGSGALPRLSMAVTSNMSLSECTQEGQESTFLPLHTPSDKQKSWIHSVSASLIFCSPSSSLPRSDGSCFSFCDKSSAIVVGFSVLSRTGKQGDNKKQETSSFLSPNYHCMIVNWVWLFRLTTVSESGFDHTPFRQGVVGGYHYHVTVSHQKDFWEMKSVWN